MSVSSATEVPRHKNRNEFWRFEMKNRNRWMERSRAESLPLNDAEFIAIRCIARAHEIKRLVVDDPSLLTALKDACTNDSAAGPLCEWAPLEIEVPTTKVATILLVSLDRIGATAIEGAAAQEGAIVLIYNWRDGWSPDLFTQKRWPPSQIFSVNTLAPAFWRVNLRLLATAPNIPSVSAVTEGVRSLINDADLDAFTLLDQIQTLESIVRGKLPLPLVPRAPLSSQRDAEMRILEERLLEAERTIALQVNMMATAYRALSK